MSVLNRGDMSLRLSFSKFSGPVATESSVVARVESSDDDDDDDDE